uniref:Uncharacterized protein n=1 Tax=Poecilia formosa TaxID=48698 RepID=A0A096MES5_POEFO
MSLAIKPIWEASCMLTLLPSVGFTIPPVQAWASSNLWAVIESTRPRFKASVIEIFSNASVSKMAPTGSTSPTGSRGGDRVIDTWDSCFRESEHFSATTLDDEHFSMIVVVFVVVVLVTVGDNGLDTTVDEEEDEEDDVIDGTGTTDFFEVDDVTEDELKEPEVPEVDSIDEEEDDEDDVIDGTGTTDVFEVDDVTEDELKEAEVPEVDSIDDDEDVTDNFPDGSGIKFDDDTDDDDDDDDEDDDDLCVA